MAYDTDDLFGMIAGQKMCFVLLVKELAQQGAIDADRYT